LKNPSSGPATERGQFTIKLIKILLKVFTKIKIPWKRVLFSVVGGKVGSFKSKVNKNLVLVT
jgi:hypothetical protein